MLSVVDPSVTAAVQGGFTDTTSLFVTTLIPALMGLVILGLAIGVGVKYLRKGANKA